jgi:hypothetical protein
MWDEYSRQHFNLKAIIFYMINDNPARLSLSGQVKGKTGCVVCVDQTESFTFHLPVSLYICGTADSYHVNTSNINREHGSMVQSKMKRHQIIEMANLCLK